MDDMEIKSSVCPRCYIISVVPYYEGEDNENHVGCKITFTIPATYPDVVPDFSLESIMGLSNKKLSELKDHLSETANSFLGMSMIFNIVEECKIWLQENNVDENAPVEEESLIDKMQKRERQKQEQIELEKRKGDEANGNKNRTDGILEGEQSSSRSGETPVTIENFMAWKARFDAEIQAKKEEELQKVNTTEKKSKKSSEEETVRITGKAWFLANKGIVVDENIKDLEGRIDGLKVNDKLFLEDENLEDLDFDDEDFNIEDFDDLDFSEEEEEEG